jgi:putative DNA primase/helicase
MFNGDGLLGVDLDHGRDPETGKLQDWASDIISELDSYTEISQSGAGIHILCYGKLPSGRRRKGNIETYETGRYFVMTGDILDDAHRDIEERTEQLAAVHEKYLTGKKPKKNAASVMAPVNLPPWEVIDKAGRAKNGGKFRQLMGGDASGYNSQSEADLALCNIIAFYTQDPSTVDVVYRQSKLMREKWDENRGEDGTYGQITVSRAIQDVTAVYAPGNPGGQPERQIEWEDLSIEEPVVKKKENVDYTTDMGRSKIFAETNKEMLHWCPDMRTWLFWNGKYWQKDKNIKVMQLAKKTVADIVSISAHELMAAVGEEDVKNAKARFKDAMKAKFEKAIKSMIELTKDELPIEASELDQNYYLLNCQNGIIDLRTGKLLEHDPKYNITKIASASFISGKKFEKFGEFMKDITCGDAELANYFKQIIGMAAVGKVFYEGMAMFHGRGQNGKSTFINAMVRVFGMYGGNIKPELLMCQRDGREPVGLAEIMGKRLIAAIETEENKRLSASMLKQLASTDPITARRLYENPITFIPTHTLILATNFLPKVGSIDDGTWRRISVVPFKARFTGKKDIKDYADVLYRYDADAILGWIVDGAVQYIANGHNIDVPKVVEDATSQYRQDENWLENFICDCCEVGDYYESGGRLFAAYKRWCEKVNEWPRRQNDFVNTLEMCGYEKKRYNNGVRWRGIKLNDDESLPEYVGWKKYTTTKMSGFLVKNEPEDLPLQGEIKM